MNIEANIFFETDSSSEFSPHELKEKKLTKKIAKATQSLEKDKNLKLILDDLDGELIKSSITPKEKP